MKLKPVGSISFIKPVMVIGHNGTTSYFYAIGDTLPFYSKNKHCWITPVGGIYFHEAKEIKQSQTKGEVCNE